MRLSILFAAGLALTASQARSQHEHQGHSQYAEEQQSHIPSLTADEFDQVRQGAGMGLAKPAELNHYPGPKHVIELADSLVLTEAQLASVEGIRERMASRAAELGRAYLHAEKELNDLFANGAANEETVAKHAAAVGEKHAALRAAHLIAHVETAAVLTADQIARYDALRGYTAKR